MAARKYQKEGGRAYLSKSDWKELMAFIRHTLQRSDNEIALAGPNTDEMGWKTWFCQFFDINLKARFWKTEGKGKTLFERYKDEILQVTMNLCRDTACKIRLERLPIVEKTRHRSTSADIYAQREQANELDMGSCRDLVSSRNYQGPGRNSAIEGLEPGTKRGQLAVKAKEQRNSLSPSVSNDDSTLPSTTEHENLTFQPCGSNLPVDRMSRKSDDKHTQIEAPAAQLRADDTAEHTVRGLPSLSSGSTALRARTSRQNHLLPAPTGLPEVYAWAVKVHHEPIHQKPIREILYRKTIPSLRRFLHEAMTARGITGAFVVHNLIVSSNNHFFRVMVNTPQEKHDWYHIASRLFETRKLVDIDLWIG